MKEKGTSPEKTVVYRLYDATDRLLYVGITSSFARRLGQHDDKFWFADVVQAKLTHFDDRALAVAAERQAIRTEHPLYNVANGSRPRGRPEPKNPARVVSFDHSRFAELSEYRAISRAQDRFVHYLQRVKPEGLNQDAWLGMVAAIAASLPLSDLPPRRICQDCLLNSKGVPYAPYAVALEDGAATSQYVCKHGHRWECWHVVTFEHQAGGG